MQRIPFARCTQTLLAAFGMTGATGLATCDSGPQSGWQWKDVLSQRLSARVEAYFHPVTRTARGGLSAAELTRHAEGPIHERMGDLSLRT